MGGLTLEAWAVIATVAGAACYGTLHILSSILRDAARRVELYRRVAEIRAEYAKQVAVVQARSLESTIYAEPVGYQLPRKAA